MLGYQFVPEKCQFDDQSRAEDNLSIYLRPPYEVSIRKFLDDLQICTTGEFSGISVYEINPDLNSGKFCVHLIVPYSLIEENIKKIFSIIDIILKDPDKLNFYCYWDIYAKKHHGADLTIVRIENLIRKRLLQYLCLDYKDVWSFIIQESGKIKFLKKQVLTDINNFPKINLIYEENGEEKEISFTRDKIVATLENLSFNNNLLDMKTKEQEFILPAGIRNFVKEKITVILLLIVNIIMKSI
ncbi:hypothetical protein [Rickettsiella massiliensis]|uniref:hypothetical protein n=1 Tax=Rickettsiella massiliensis TaxID=676517 RepID=UPI00029AE465|nr:hypothetical protein [Rickettsiella massiliensis]